MPRRFRSYGAYRERLRGGLDQTRRGSGDVPGAGRGYSATSARRRTPAALGTPAACRAMAADEEVGASLLPSDSPACHAVGVARYLGS